MEFEQGGRSPAHLLTGSSALTVPAFCSLNAGNLYFLLNAACHELMLLLDHLEEQYGVRVTADDRFKVANELVTVGLLLRIGEPTLPWFLPSLRDRAAERRHPYVMNPHQMEAGIRA